MRRRRSRAASTWRRGSPVVGGSLDSRNCADEIAPRRAGGAVPGGRRVARFSRGRHAEARGRRLARFSGESGWRGRRPRRRGRRLARCFSAGEWPEWRGRRQSGGPVRSGGHGGSLASRGERRRGGLHGGPLGGMGRGRRGRRLARWWVAAMVGGGSAGDPCVGALRQVDARGEARRSRREMTTGRLLIGRAPRRAGSTRRLVGVVVFTRAHGLRPALSSG